MAKTGTLKDNATGEVVYPITLASNVYDANGNGITSRLPKIETTQFVDSEYEKTLNLLNIKYLNVGKTNHVDESLSNNSITGTATGTYAYRVYYMNNLEVGKTYTISFDGIAKNSSDSPRVFIGNDGNNADNNVYGVNWIGTTLNRFSKTFTATNNTLSICLYVSGSSYTSGNYITISNIMLNDGNTALPYKLYNGAIAHKVDITPVLLWQNGSPNAQFSPQEITTSNMSDYSIIRFGFKHWHESPTAVQYQDFKYEVNAYGTINSVQHHQLKSRGFVINSATKIWFEAGRESNNNSSNVTSDNNGQIVPIYVYGIK
jgi:hypothetical protein